MEQLAINTTVKLRSGIEIPQLGFGTFESSPQEVGDSVKWAIEAGYRHIDNAKAYDNEKEVGQALSECGVDRDKLFIATKVWMSDYHDIIGAFKRTADKLSVDYLDLLMLHWPGTDEDARYRAYDSLLKLKDKGLIRTVGVSNFMIDHLEGVKEKFGEYPEYNQIQIHPWGQQNELRAFCRENEIAVAAWGPLMHGHLKEAKELDSMSKVYEHSPAQLVLRWHLQKGNIVIPKSVNRNRIQENRNLYDFSLTEADMRIIDALEKDWHWGPDAYSFHG